MNTYCSSKSLLNKIPNLDSDPSRAPSRLIALMFPNPVARLEKAVEMKFSDRLDESDRQIVKTLKLFNKAKHYVDGHGTDISTREFVLLDQIMPLEKRYDACTKGFVNAIEKSGNYEFEEDALKPEQVVTLLRKKEWDYPIFAHYNKLKDPDRIARNTAVGVMAGAGVLTIGMGVMNRLWNGLIESGTAQKILIAYVFAGTALAAAVGAYAKRQHNKICMFYVEKAIKMEKLMSDIYKATKIQST